MQADLHLEIESVLYIIWQLPFVVEQLLSELMLPLLALLLPTIKKLMGAKAS